MKCVGCGCTDERACPMGCYWRSRKPPVCSRCEQFEPKLGDIWVAKGDLGSAVFPRYVQIIFKKGLARIGYAFLPRKVDERNVERGRDDFVGRYSFHRPGPG